jgi:uncharacterized protein (DUF302 family)
MCSVMSEAGLVTVACEFPVDETVDRLVEAVTAVGLTVFARIDHAANAAEAGLELRPTQLLILGNPRGGGTPLMQDRQTAGIDLPVKALAWPDEDGRVWLTCNDAAWRATRHGLGARSHAAIAAIAAGLAAITVQASGHLPAD